MSDTPRDRLQATLDGLHPSARWVRVEAIDLAAFLTECPEHGSGDGCACYNRGYDHGLTDGERQ
jgi:hypothetical protein